MTVSSPSAVGREAAPSGFRAALRLRFALARERIVAWAFFDSRLARASIGAFVQLAAALSWSAGRRIEAFRWLARAHRADLFAPANRRAEALARRFADRSDEDLARGRDAFVRAPETDARLLRFEREPLSLLNGMAIPLKSPRPKEKGVVLLRYSHAFRLFAKCFDVARVQRDYVIVLEPDWSGFCDEHVLAYAGAPEPVVVEAYEPRDAAFVAGLGSNLVPVAISSNWWVDHRLFRPIGIEPDVDVVMLAAWASFKRHDDAFRALAAMRPKPRVLLVGYPQDLSRDDVLARARLRGLDDRVEVHEWVAYEGVNALLNRARSNLLWSRREGVNRAIVEGLFADVPCVVRRGLNYGHEYPHVNSRTGAFASASDLAATLERILGERARFAPRAWALENMSCERATAMLAATLRRLAESRGERWTVDPVVKVNRLHGVEYWDPADAARFAEDRERLAAARRRA